MMLEGVSSRPVVCLARGVAAIAAICLLLYVVLPAFRLDLPHALNLFMAPFLSSRSC